MKSKNNILYCAGLAALMTVSFTSCDDFLDEMPDNRTQIDTEDKVVRLITSAYPASTHVLVTECMSDNVDDMGPRYSAYTTRFFDEIYAWKDVTEDPNDSPRRFWQSCYNAIANANEALQAIEDMGGANTVTLKEAKAEALLCRAYSHFLLTNVFCLNYNAATSSTDLGITYMTKPETTVNPEYSRGSVQTDYEMMDKDIENALKDVGDTHLDVPKYHFNKLAAYAFAARFYLFYEKWDKAAKYASLCLGSSPKTMLRDWDEMESYGVTDDLQPRTNKYIDASDNSNLLLLTAASDVSLWNSNYFTYSKYTHGNYISSTEDLKADNIWGSAGLVRCPALEFLGGTLDRVLVARLPRLIEWADQAEGIGVLRTVVPAFKSDLTLLERAEAYVMMREYDLAAADLTTWMQNWTRSTVTLTPEKIVDYYKDMPFWQWDNPTFRKKLNPAFEIDEPGSVQECMLQCVLNFKRIETSYEGMRWFDVKRYGITVYRRTMNDSGEPKEVTDSLPANDLRRAIQLPSMVIQAGVEANPR